jgi:hypothetical protein
VEAVAVEAAVAAAAGAAAAVAAAAPVVVLAEASVAGSAAALAEASAAATEARVAAVTVVAMAEETGTSSRLLLGLGGPRALPVANDKLPYPVRSPPATAVMPRSPGRASPPAAGRPQPVGVGSTRGRSGKTAHTAANR